MRYLLPFSLTLLLHSVFAQDTATLEDIKYKVGDTIHINEIRFPFHETLNGYNSAETLRPTDSISDILKARPTLKIRIENHTDSRGSTERNRELSLNRANLVRDRILSNGIDSSRIEIIGYGEDQPILKKNTSFNSEEPIGKNSKCFTKEIEEHFFIVTEN